MRTTDYALSAKQLRALAEEERDPVALCANASALLYEAMADVNWAGFYFVRGDALVLGPFQGKVACVRIAKGKGVCGTAWAEDRPQLVPDVHAFPGHIACDAASASEVVIPLHAAGKVVGVLDIDSPVKGRFTEEDQEGLVLFAQALEEVWDF